MKYQCQVVWNREFDWKNFGSTEDELQKAIDKGKDIMNSGDGARVKKARVVDEFDKVIVERISA